MVIGNIKMKRLRAVCLAIYGRFLIKLLELCVLIVGMSFIRPWRIKDVI